MDALPSLLDFRNFGWLDALDVLIVALIAYGVIMLLRRTRSAPVAIGILIFFVIWQASLALHLETLGTLLSIGATALPIVVVILFQNTIRRALVNLGRNPLFRFFAPQEGETLVESVSLAVLSLSAQGLGAIIAIEREIGLRGIAASGIPIDAKVSYELLLALFHPRSPLHDGAVILSHGRIAAAACLLPLTTKPQLSVKYGSRHRAALGLSEETDAIVIVVSEERGTISVVRDGELHGLEAKELRDTLRRELGLEPARLSGPAVAST